MVFTSGFFSNICVILYSRIIREEVQFFIRQKIFLFLLSFVILSFQFTFMRVNNILILQNNGYLATIKVFLQNTMIYRDRCDEKLYRYDFLFYLYYKINAVFQFQWNEMRTSET